VRFQTKKRTTADDVRRVAARYFPPQDFNTVVVGAAP
jgi:predicted Zn-dependent peptidase